MLRCTKNQRQTNALQVRSEELVMIVEGLMMDVMMVEVEVGG
jgi:hypothetical protein